MSTHSSLARRSTRRAAVPVLVLASGLFLAGCGSGAEDASAPAETVTVTETVTVAADPSAASSGPSTEDPEPTEDPAPAEDAEASFEDGVLVTPDLRIEITSHKVIAPGEKGNEYGEKPVIAFYYSITNVSGDDIDPLSFIFNFEAYQDNDPNAENSLGVGALPDDRFLDSQSETIKKGGTVESAIAYELDDLTTPVDLVATEGFGDELGRVSYEIA